MPQEKRRFIDEELLKKIKGIQLRAKYLVNDAFSGEYKSAFKGRGMEFEEVREYVPGDDIRSIDWNVTARSQKPYIKVYRDEREITVMFVVDVSASSRFGTLTKFKNEIVSEVTALLAYLALRNNDKVGLIIYSDQVEQYIPPKKGRGHVFRLISDILSYKSKSNKTNMQIPLEFLNRVLKKKAITFLISDFQGDEYKTQLQTTARHHDLIAIDVTDPREIDMPKIGYIELEDAETGEFVLFNTSDNKLRQGYRKESLKQQKSRMDFFRRSEIDYIPIKTEENYLEPIIKFFKERERRR